MKKYFILLLILILLSRVSSAQHEADNWYFGHYSAITFSTNPPSFLPGSQINQSEGCTSISDAAGNLLFYSDGVSVWDRQHNIMPNGTGLWGDVSSTQSALAVKLPGSSTLYYLFTAPYYYSTHPLAYSIIDMSLNGGMGDVISTAKNVTVLDSSTEKLAAVKHANGTDVWILGHPFDSGDFYAYLLTPSGLNTVPVVSTAGVFYSNFFYQKVGCLKFSPGGHRVAAAVPWSSCVELFDFDNLTGILSHPINFQIVPSSFTALYGVEFSPDESKLYAVATYASQCGLIQYNLFAGNDSAIVASADTISLTSCPGFTPLGSLQTGPDGRIYVAVVTSDTLGCINNPNLLGAACNYNPNFIYVDTNVVLWGLPNLQADLFYNLNTEISSASNSDIFLSVEPNPAKDAITISFANYFSNAAQKQNIEVLDVLGNIILSQPLINSKTQTVNVAALAQGVYFLRAGNNSSKFVKE